jgi:hypothetical protein
VIENPKRPEIKMSHWNMTEEFALGWQRDAGLAIEASRHSDKSDLETKAWGLIIQHAPKGGITARRIQQLCNRTADEIAPVLDKWIRLGSVDQKIAGKTWVYLPNEK